MPQPLMDHAEGERALIDINTLFHYRRIPFFLIQGTALGAYRDNGFSQYEKDID